VEVNKQLDKMGYNIGLRLIEDFLAKSNTMKRCANFKETAEMISKVGHEGFVVFVVLCSTLIFHVGRFQDLSQYHTYHHQLDKRQ